ncbi:MAG: DUF4291 domain-containing protein [Pseudomonadota bacterium]
MALTKPERQIRAAYDDTIVRVYQAYSHQIANAALASGTFVTPTFKMDRMTWIKPSFLWMMYRSGWAKKDADQLRILAIDISRSGFEWALENSCLSHRPAEMDQETWQHLKAQSPVRVQWDPERNLQLEPQQHRAIQIGLSGIALEKYVSSWIRSISDITDFSLEISLLVSGGQMDLASSKLPNEEPYPLSDEMKERLGVNKVSS